MTDLQQLAIWHDPDNAPLVVEIKRLRAEVKRLRADRDEWKQAAGVEAGLRREFLADNEWLRSVMRNAIAAQDFDIARRALEEPKP